jgi:hypothetical protein
MATSEVRERAARMASAFFGSLFSRITLLMAYRKRERDRKPLEGESVGDTYGVPAVA